MKINKLNRFEKSLHKHVFLAIFAILFSSITMSAQNITVSGMVTGSEDGLPIPGVAIIVEGTRTGAVTDFDGNYSISAKIGDKLELSYLGMETKTVVVTSATLNVQLESSIEGLEEVVVVGYGAVKKKEVTGAVAQVKAEQIENFITQDVASTLQGQIAGVSVSAGSGEPGEASSIQIRGVTSLSGTNTPLFVVNGIPQIGDPGLSPNEIETIDVLKDAASTAVYGSRGAAGVILITTKRGKEGAMSVDFETNYGLQFLGEGTPLMNTEDQLYFETTRFNNWGGFTPLITNNPEWLNNDNTFDDYVLVDPAEVQTYRLNINGGTKNLSYNVSGSLFDQDGALINSNFKRYNGRITTRYKSENWEINASVALTYEDRRRSSGGLIVTASRYRPYFPEIDPDSDVAIVNSSGGTQTPAVALGQALKRKDDSNRDRTNASLGIRRNIYGGLQFITNLGISVTNDFRNVFRPRFDLFNPDDEETLVDPTRSGVSTTATRIRKFSWDAGLAFKKKYGKHNISAQAIVTLEDDNSKTFEATIEGIATNSVTTLNGGTINENVSSGFDFTTKRVGTLGRVQYNYAGRYIISALARYDGSSRFGEEFRWGTFPSVSFAWNVASEPFWKNLKKTVNQFKIRLSHGEVGNDSFSDYEFVSTLAPFADYVFAADDSSVDFGSSVRSFANRNVKWETSVSDNIGVDLSFFRNKLNLTVDYYNTEKEDMLFPVTLPGSSGAYYDSSIILNVGNMTNQGLEVSANYKANIGKSKLTLGGTFTTNDNEITKVTSEGIIFNGNSNLISGDPGSQTTVIAKGFEAGAFFLFETDGVVQTQEQLDAYRQFPSRSNALLGDLRYVDTNGDGDITNEDRVYKGSGLADYEIGFNLRWEYANFDFSMNWFGTVGAEILNGNKAGTYNWSRHQDLVNMWTPENPTSNIPAFQGRGNQHPNYAGTTDLWLENGDYLRLKQATLGYSLSKETCDKIGLNKFRVYVSAQNPLTITGYDGYDPEVGNNNVARRGLDVSRYPLASTYSLGLKLAF